MDVTLTIKITAIKIAMPSSHPSAIPSLMHPIIKETNAAAHNNFRISSSKQPTISSHNVFGGLASSSLCPNALVLY